MQEIRETAMTPTDLTTNNVENTVKENELLLFERNQTRQKEKSLYFFEIS